MLRALALALLIAGCDCGASHRLDAGGLPDAPGTDAAPDAGRDAGRDSGLPPLPPDACERVHMGEDGFPCGPDTLLYCGYERCCGLSAVCESGRLVPGEPRCTERPVTEECALDVSNAAVTLTVDGVTHEFAFGYVDHGIGFATYADVTFTTDRRADVCTAQRLSISGLEPDFEAGPEEGAYTGTHEVRFHFFDAMATPNHRFFDGTMTILESEPFRVGGPLVGEVEAEDEGLTLAGRFDAAECEEWRTSGS